MMSTINSMTSGAMHSPRTQMDQRISAAVSAGAISSTDQAALGTALDAIDSSLAAERASGSKPSGNMKSRIDGLIQQQVDSGTLSDEQASELQSFFAKGAEGSEGKGPGGPGGPPPAGDQSSDDDAGEGSGVSDAASSKLAALEAFLERLRESEASTTGYGVAGKTSNATGLVLDSLA